jgi:hypothetical protein
VAVEAAVGTAVGTLVIFTTYRCGKLAPGSRLIAVVAA